MNSEEKRKLGYGFNIGATTGSAVLGGAPLSIILVVSIIFGLIGFCTMLITYLIKILSKVFIKKRGN